MQPFDRITVDPGKCGGKPCIRGMRFTVRRVLELLAGEPDQSVVLAEYPFLEPADIHQVLLYAAATVDDDLKIMEQGNWSDPSSFEPVELRDNCVW